MKVKIYYRCVNGFIVLVETDGWYKFYWNNFSNPNRIFRKLKSKKLSIKIITKLFHHSPIEYTESEIDRYIKRCIERGISIIHVVSYEK